MAWMAFCSYLWSFSCPALAFKLSYFFPPLFRPSVAKLLTLKGEALTVVTNKPFLHRRSNQNALTIKELATHQTTRTLGAGAVYGV
jgi:hypothetical protein